MNVAFGRVCAHFAGTLVAIVAMLAVTVLAPWLVYTLLAVIAAGNAIIGIAVYLEMHRAETVKGRGGREVP